MNKKIILANLFFLGIIAATYFNWIGITSVALVFLVICLKFADIRFPASILLAFLTSFFLYQIMNHAIAENIHLSKELRILLNRTLLVIIVAGLVVAHLLNKKTLLFFNNIPKWNYHLKMPFHTIKVSHFVFIGVLVSGSSFIPVILQKEPDYLQSILFFCIAFSLINAIFEEVIWRGFMLASLKEHTSVPFAIMITSIGFGLMHLSIGFSFVVSFLFSFGGLFYGIVVLKTNSLYPAILFHFVINVGMVFSGMVL